MSSVVVFGGYGTFGALVVRELARLGTIVTVAGRDLQQAEQLARSLGSGHRGLAADVTRLDSCRAVLAGQQVAVNCAGPFSRFDDSLLRACLEARCHYADLSDDRSYVARVRGYTGRFREQGLAAVFGCSSLPGISGALAVLLRDQSAAVPERARITLFLGNRNPKGHAAVRSLVGGLGKPILASHGTLRGFRDREVVPLPKPFGRRAVFNMDSPDYDVLPEHLGVRSVSVKVGFELRLATYGFALLAALGFDYGTRTARLLGLAGKAFGRLGCSGGAVMTELFFADGSTCRATLVARQDGQRMAALPCALVAHKLGQSAPPTPGAWTAYEFLGAVSLLDRLVAAGFDLDVIPRQPPHPAGS